LKAEKMTSIELIAGIDEAGRGPLAGPVVAAAVILPQGHGIKGIKDSKKLSPKRREVLFAQICEQAQYGVGIISEQVIDEINILQATFQAMREAVANISVQPSRLIIDGNMTIPNHHLPQTAIVNGDDTEEAISAASIIAKVTRDRLMLEMHEKYPKYEFAKHKGYGTPIHIAAIRQHGLCPIHRRSFCGNFQ
jgi:ribonuclease HII